MGSTAVITTSPRKHARKAVSRLRKPPEMLLEAWQIALRKQFAAELRLQIGNVGREPVFSEFAVTNPRTKRTYRVAIRGQGLGENFCSCPDFAVNTLGTCKHIEGVLARLRRTRGGTGGGVPAGVQRGVPPLRRQARGRLPGGHRLPRRDPANRGGFLRR